MFHLLDDGDGEVTREEFINGIMHCKGEARAIDQVIMHAELKQLAKRMEGLACRLQEKGFVHSVANAEKTASLQKQGRAFENLSGVSEF